MCVWPQRIRTNGIALFNRPIMANGRHAETLSGSAMPVARASAIRIAAAMATRPNATVNGGSSCNATLPKKNEPPHRTDSATSSSQSVADMVRRAEVGAIRHAEHGRAAAATRYPVTSC